MLRTGRMLPPLESDIREVSLSTRLWWDENGSRKFFCNIGPRWIDEYPNALYEDLENPGQLVLVVGNRVNYVGVWCYSEFATVPT